MYTGKCARTPTTAAETNERLCSVEQRPSINACPMTMNIDSIHNGWQEEDKKGLLLEWSLSTRKKPGKGWEMSICLFLVYLV